MSNETNLTMNGSETTGTGQSTGATEASNGTTSGAANVKPRSTLYRHSADKVLGGVCGGVAEYLNWDPVLVRALWVVLTLVTSGAGFLAYLALWLLLPVGSQAGGQERPAAIQLNGDNMRRAAYVLIALGMLWLLANVGILPVLSGVVFGIVRIVFWPLLLIGVGYLLLRGLNSGDWKLQFGDWFNHTRDQVNGKLPSSAEVRSGFHDMQQRIPLRRSRNDRLILGVCGGIGQRLGIDSNLVRLVWVALSIGSVGMGVLIYVIAGVFLPEEEPTTVQPFTDNVQDVQVIDGTAVHKV
jgi:phage shock protein PspC (stress-responsive transcriptional regulator)